MSAELDLLLRRLVERCPSLERYGDQLLEWEIDRLVETVAPALESELEQLLRERIDRQA